MECGTLEASDHIWRRDQLHLLGCTVTVPAGATLTIEPGTAIYAMREQEPVSILVLEHGRVDARGTIDAPIRLLAPPWLEPQVMPHRAGATPRSAPPSTMSVFAHIKAEFGAPRFRIGSLAEIERCDAHCYAPTTFPTTSAWNLITPPRAPPPPSPPRPPPSPPPLPPSG